MRVAGPLCTLRAQEEDLALADLNAWERILEKGDCNAREMRVCLIQITDGQSNANFRQLLSIPFQFLD